LTLTMMRPIVCVLVTAIASASGSESQRVRFGPGVCGPIDPIYIKVATETGGQPFPVSPAEVGRSSRIMESSLQPEMILWATGHSEDSYLIPVDPTVVRMMFSGTFDATGGSLTLIAPDGTVIQQGDRIEDTPLNCGRIVTVDAPASGTWQVRMAPSHRFWLRVHAKSDLSLTDAEFVEQDAGTESDRLVKIQGEPIAGRPATLRVSVSSTFKTPTFQLVSLAGRPLQTIDLQSADNLEFIGTITLPIEPFRVLVTGRDESGIPTQRIWPGLFHGEVVEVVPPAGETVPAGTEMPVTFTIRNHGPAVRLNLVSSDHRGRVIAVEPPTLELGAGAEGIATVQLKVPADTRQASEASIRLTATSDGTAAVGGFNSANKRFTVIRE
jgi:von Willebrand factor A domain-containing protein 7